MKFVSIILKKNLPGVEPGVKKNIADQSMAMWVK